MKISISKQLSQLKSYAEAGNISLAHQSLDEFHQQELGPVAKTVLARTTETYGLSAYSKIPKQEIQFPSSALVSEIGSLSMYRRFVNIQVFSLYAGNPYA